MWIRLARRNIRTRFYSQSHGSRQQNVALRSGLVLIQATETTPTHNALESLRQQTTKHAASQRRAPTAPKQKTADRVGLSPSGGANYTPHTGRTNVRINNKTFLTHAPAQICARARPSRRSARRRRRTSLVRPLLPPKRSPPLLTGIKRRCMLGSPLRDTSV